MMKTCKNCGKQFPLRAMVDGKKRNFQTRKYCLECSPFGSGNRKKLGDVPKKKYPQKSGKFIAWQRKARQDRKLQLTQLLGGKCSACGYHRCMGALDFHHTDPRKKDFGLASKGLLRKWEDVVKEAQKCVLLCRNCHAELHYPAGVAQMV